MKGTTITIERAERSIYKQVGEFLAESDCIYPGIERWWQRRVVPGIPAGQRVCRVALDNEKVVAIAIGKRSQRSAKLCTLRVAHTHRGHGIGEQLIRTTLTDLLDSGARRVHYTISEQVLDHCGGFFEPYKFRVCHWQRNLYVRGLDELTFFADSPQIRQALFLDRYHAMLRPALSLIAAFAALHQASDVARTSLSSLERSRSHYLSRYRSAVA